MRTRDAAAITAAALTLVASCGASHAATAAVPWTALRNPIYSDTRRAVKDPALVAVGSEWVVLFSAVDAKGTWRIGMARSRDLRAWSPATTLPHDPAVDGEASPDVVRAPDGRFVVTYQSFVHDRRGAPAKLYARTTKDFRAFSAPIPLAANLHPASQRMIDAALAWTPAGLLLGYKVGSTDAGSTQHFELARSPSGRLEGPWVVVGRPDIVVYGDTIENYQFVTVDGSWHLLATSNVFDRPQWFTLVGDARQPRGWLHWTAARELHVPQEPWNTGRGLTGATYEHANCAFLVDRRATDGYFYLVYADAAEMSSFGSQGHARLAIARSRDLVHWSVPPG